ncbi:hypothetical protein ABZ400_35590 [Streptomyces sp. NPDC005897]|uniref:hypothetical protein n=1 Tax=Streptomyces sp. NPDC005897 TaxID=3157081 RepID=UPI0033DC2F33
MSSAGGMGVMGMTSGMSSAGSTGVNSGMTTGMTGSTSSVGGTVSTGGTDGVQVSWKAVWWVVPALLGGAFVLFVAFFLKEIYGLRRGRRKN